MDDISLFISLETTEKRKYLIDFFKKVRFLKKKNKNVDVYHLGMKDNPNFWAELYENDPLPEEKCPRKYIRVGPEFQVDI